MLPCVAKGVAAVLDSVLNVMVLVITASVLISWVNADPNNPIVNMIQRVTEPIMRPFKKLTQNIPGPIDWTPMIVLLLILFLQNSFISYLRSLAVGC